MPRAPLKSANWWMSVPDARALDPFPCKITTRASVSCATISRWRDSCSYMVHVMALRYFSLAKVRRTTLPDRDNSTVPGLLAWRFAFGSSVKDFTNLWKLNCIQYSGNLQTTQETCLPWVIVDRRQIKCGSATKDESMEHKFNNQRGWLVFNKGLIHMSETPRGVLGHVRHSRNYCQMDKSVYRIL